jgi:hypothetical protein
MRRLLLGTRKQAMGWWVEAGLPAQGSQLSYSGLQRVATYGVPGDAGRKTALARMLVDGTCVSGVDCMLLITGVGIWPSSENRTLFQALRRGFGHAESLDDAPGHRFSVAEKTEFECVLDLVLYFSWDATLWTGDGLVVHLSHDEVLEVLRRIANQRASADLVSSLDRLGLSALHGSS